MSKTSKIKSVGTPKEWSNTNGTFYYFQIELENGDRGSIGSKDNPPSWLKVGETLEYDLKETDKGNQIKRVQQNTFKKGGGYKPDTLGIAIGQGMNLANEAWCAGKIDKEKIKAMAKWYAELSYELREELKHLDK